MPMPPSSHESEVPPLTSDLMTGATPPEDLTERGPRHRRGDQSHDTTPCKSFLLELADLTRNLVEADEILLVTLERLACHLGVGRAGYIEPSRDGGFTVAREWREGIASFVGDYSIDRLDDRSRELLMAGRPLRFEDTQASTDMPATAATLRQTGARSAVCVPLVKDNRLAAALGLSHSEARKWSDSDCQLILEVAERTWETLQRARVEADLRTAKAVQTFLLKLSDFTRDEPDAEALLETTAQMLGEYLGVSRIVYSEVDDREEAMIPRRQWARGVPDVPEAEMNELDPDSVQRLASGEILKVNDVRREQHLTGAEFLERHGTLAYLCVPLLKDGRHVASWTATDHRPRIWEDSEVSLVTEVAERTWASLRRARAEAELRVAQANQSFLLQLSDATRDEPSADVILERNVEMLGHHLRVSRVAYAEVSENGQSFNLSHEWTNGIPKVGGTTRFSDMDPASVAAVQSGKIVKASNVWETLDRRYAEVIAGNHAIAFLSVPLVKADRYLGCLTITHHEEREWSQCEVALAAEVAERTWATLQRARAEADLRESEGLLSAFMENAPIGMYLKDEQGRYLIANSEMEKLFGRPIADVIGRTADDLCGPAEAAEVASWDRRLMETGESFSFEQERPQATAYRSALVMRFPVRTCPQEPLRIGGFDIDLSEQRKMKSELERSREALSQSEKLTALGSLLAGVSHELNNPLSVVVGQALIMEQKAPDEATAVRAAKIRTAAERCSKIVQTFLAMARQRQPERQLVDVNELIGAAVDLMTYGLRAAGVAVRLELASDLPRLLADASQLHQLFANLIVNAQHALESVAGVRQLRIRTFATNGEVVVEVADTGPGIPTDIRHRIFEPFFTTKPVGSGTGLGLSFAYGVAKAHGGELKLSEAGPGTMFTLFLPIRSSDSERPPVTADGASNGGSGRVLIIDDEPEIAETLAEMLESRGWEAIVANGGRAAMDRLQEGDFDLVITDLRMPEVDGADLFAWVQAHRPELEDRFAFLTGDTLGTHAGTFLAQASRPFTNKPFSPASIQQLVCEVQERRSTNCNHRTDSR
jgi:PAS domain S-box-containing protein